MSKEKNNELREIYDVCDSFELTEEKTTHFLAKLKFPFGKLDWKNGNNRTYTSDNTIPAIEEFDSKLQSDKILSQVGHPAKGSAVAIKDGSHIITKTWVDDAKTMWAEAMLLNTGKGRDVMTILNSGVKIGASLRGIGKTNTQGHVEKGLKIMGVDIVSNPSFHQHAELTSANIISESLEIEAVEEMVEEWKFNEAVVAGYKGTIQEYQQLNFEKFFSLDDAIRDAIRNKFGKEFWIVSFSDSEIIFRGAEDTEDKYRKIAYVLKNETIELADNSEPVKKEVSYENQSLEEIEEEILSNVGAKRDEAMLEHYYSEAIEAGFNGTFEDFKKLTEEAKIEEK